MPSSTHSKSANRLANQRKRKEQMEKAERSVTVNSCSSVFRTCVCVCVSVSASVCFFAIVCTGVYAKHAIWVNNIVTAVCLVRFPSICLSVWLSALSPCVRALPILNGNLNMPRFELGERAAAQPTANGYAKWHLIVKSNIHYLTVDLPYA